MWDAHRKTDATVEPVTLEKAKEHLRVDWNTDDTYIPGLITAARQKCESYSNRAYISQTWIYKASGFSSVMELPMPNLISVTSVKYTKSDGSIVRLVENTDFAVETNVQPGYIHFPDWVNSPQTDYSGAYPVEIEYVCGYGDTADDVPEVVKQAILLMVGHLYENRENTVIGAGISAVDLPQGAQWLLDSDRVISI